MAIPCIAMTTNGQNAEPVTKNPSTGPLGPRATTKNITVRMRTPPRGRTTE